MGNRLSEWLLNGEYSENAVLTNENWECVETIRSQPKSYIDMVKTQSSPQREIGYGDIVWEENPVDSDIRDGSTPFSGTNSSHHTSTSCIKKH